MTVEEAPAAIADSVAPPALALAPAPTVLLVEDNPTLRHTAAHALSRAGLQVVSAAHSMEALRVLDDGGARIDLLVTDVWTPPGTPHGFALARMARARRPHLKVVYIAGMAVPEHELDTAPGPVLRKPVEADALVAEAVRALQGRK